MPGFNIDPNFIKQQQEFLRGNALKNLKEKPKKSMSAGKLFIVLGVVFVVLIGLCIVFWGS